ncbi:hypothetical protein DFH07DRAFT_784610 [Mycena maculata]|uniref:Uncharacterized protein n=1 Tax=Mycena maculata TaxID=230809 RepID=A0AAD7MIU0_9AGAR|nr:hypothetical protein DFH07DRAFT_784610 [Mycena maculata]
MRTTSHTIVVEIFPDVTCSLNSLLERSPTLLCTKTYTDRLEGLGQWRVLPKSSHIRHSARTKYHEGSTVVGTGVKEVRGCPRSSARSGSRSAWADDSYSRSRRSTGPCRCWGWIGFPSGKGFGRPGERGRSGRGMLRRRRQYLPERQDTHHVGHACRPECLRVIEALFAKAVSPARGTTERAEIYKHEAYVKRNKADKLDLEGHEKYSVN